MRRTYSELQRLNTHEDRFEYLALRGVVGEKTFGYDRWMNQSFYSSRQWKQLRQKIILRDNACDMGVDGFDIHDSIYIHHMNPMGVNDIVEYDPAILDPEFLIAVTLRTHNAIHYGDKRLLAKPLVERRPGDTKLW
jgi:hypothetical protein